jgi:hypothetical protein
MSTYIQNYGITKTFIQENNKKKESEIKWNGNYDGNMANIQLNINDNGNKGLINMKLNNEDIINLFTVQSVDKPLFKRLTDDFLMDMNMNKSIVKKSKKHRKYHKKQYKSKRRH